MNRKSRKSFLSFMLCFAMLFTLLTPIPAGAKGDIGDSIIPPNDLLMPLVGTSGNNTTSDIVYEEDTVTDGVVDSDLPIILTSMYGLDGVRDFVYNATVYDMYVNGYTNRLIHMPENKSYPDVTFIAGDGYSLVPINELNSESLRLKDYYNKVKGDKNDKVVVFDENTPLEGLILRADAGHVFLTGFPKKATAHTADVLATVYMDIGGTKYAYEIKFANNNEIKAWPTSSNYVVSHGYATITDSARDKYYALGSGTSASQTNANLGTWYPGNGETLIFPYIATDYNKLQYYLYTKDESGSIARNTTGYVCPFVRASFTFNEAAATLADSGLLNLTLSIGETYTIHNALIGSFPHLRSNCVGTKEADTWGNMFDLTNGIIATNGKEVTALKAGTTQTEGYITFNAQNNCNYWGGLGVQTYTVRVKITVVGGINYEVGEGGATVETELGSTVYVQRYDEDSQRWETLALYENESGLTSAGKTSGVDAVVVDCGTHVEINADGNSFVVREETPISITGLAPGWAYRLVKENSGVYNTSAFFNVPEKPTAIAEVDKTNEAKGSITVTQKYGAYDTTYIEEYRLQILKDDGNADNPEDWFDVTAGDGNKWTSAIGEDEAVVFKNLDSSKTYRVVSRMKENKITKADDNYNETDTVVASAITYGYPLTFGDKQIVKGSAVLYIEGGIDIDDIDLKTIYEVLCSEGDNCSDEEGFTPGGLTFTTTDTGSKVATLTEEGQLTLGTKYGNLNITANAAATDTHSSGKLDFEVVVIPKFLVSLTPDKSDKNGITFKPDYYDLNSWLEENGKTEITDPNTEESRFLLDNNSPIMQYREKGNTEWKSIPDDKWNWEKGLTLDYENLKPNTDYEVQLTASNGKGTSASDSITFKTPPAKDSGLTGDGTIKVEVGIESDNPNNPDLDKDFTVILKNGDDVISVKKGTADEPVDEKTIIGTINFYELPSGDYTVEVLYNDSKQTTAVAVTKDEKNPTVKVTFDGYIKKTAVKYAPSTKTIITVRGLYDMYSGTFAIVGNKGITQADIATIEADGFEGSALIELIVEDVDENTSGIDKRGTAVSKIKTLAGNQRFAKLVDLTLEKTITPNNAIPSNSQTTALIESNNYLDILIQTGKIKGRDIRVLRVHDADKTDRSLESNSAVAQVIPEAVNVAGKLVWAKNYTSTDNCNGYAITGGQPVSATSEYFVLNDDSITLHVKKFSLYAVVYSVGSSSGSGSEGGSDKPSDKSDGDGYDITTPGSKDGSFIGGKITTSATTGNEDDIIVVTTIPDEGYKLEQIIVTTKDGNNVKVTDEGNNKYSFIMPKAEVYITPIFARIVATPEETGISRWFDLDNHFSYINGYPEGDVRPLNNMTRAEATQMFFNLMRTQNVTDSKTFADIEAGAWYQKAVSTMAGLNLVSGYEDGTFRPNNKITRAEFAAMAMRFVNLKGSEATFTDVPPQHWAYNYIMSAAGYGWVNGYEDRTYRPEHNITRAEVVSIVNRMLYRFADKNYIDTNTKELKSFTDLNDKAVWYYYDMREATNTHDFVRDDSVETWTSVR